MTELREERERQILKKWLAKRRREILQKADETGTRWGRLGVWLLLAILASLLAAAW